MNASSIDLGSDYEVQIGHFSSSRARATLLSKYAPGMWNCRVVEDDLSRSSAPHGATHIVASRNVVRPWQEAAQDYKTQAAVDRAWRKANDDAQLEVESLFDLLASHAQFGREFIDIDSDSSGLPGEVTVTVDITLPELRRLAAALSPESDISAPSASPLSELISA